MAVVLGAVRWCTAAQAMGALINLESLWTLFGWYIYIYIYIHTHIYIYNDDGQCPLYINIIHNNDNVIIIFIETRLQDTVGKIIKYRWIC